MAVAAAALWNNWPQSLKARLVVTMHAPRADERRRRGRFLDELGDARSARRLLGLHTTGMP